MSDKDSHKSSQDFDDYEGEFAKDTQKRKQSLILATTGLLLITGAILYIVFGQLGTMSTQVRQLGKDQLTLEEDEKSAPPHATEVDRSSDDTLSIDVMDAETNQSEEDTPRE